MSAPDTTKPGTAKPSAPPPGPGPRLGATIGVVRVENFGPTVRRLLGRIRPEAPTVAVMIVMALSSATLAAITPWVLGRATDVVVAGIGAPDGVDFAQLRARLVQATILFLASSLFAMAQSYLLAGVVQRTMFRLRAEVEDKLHHLPLPYVDRHARGDLLSRVTNDIDNLSQSMQQTLNQFLTSALTVIGMATAMLVLSPLMALIAVATIPLTVVLVRTVTRRSARLFARQWSETGAVNAQVEEVFTGHTLVRLFGRRNDVATTFTARNDALFEASFRAQFLSGLVQPVMAFLSNLNFVLIAVVGAVRVSSGSMTLGELQAFIQYSRSFTQPLMHMASIFNVFQSGVASAERVFELLDAPEESPDSPGPALAPATGRVVFDGVYFAYDADQPLITDLSLVAEPGQTVAIVGPTGAGKTTLVNLLLRFYELDRGTITLDGVDIAAMGRAELRARMGMVLQDTWLFTGTIRDNLCYGNPDADESQMLEAARITSVDQFVRTLPQGYDTVIDEQSTSLSSGERQLITVARALLANPNILILDEATSSIDSRTELLISEAMSALRAGRTSFVIAHRLSTIRSADVIVVMEDGRIVEQGSHDELLAAQGAYYRLHQSATADPVSASENGRPPSLPPYA